MKRIVGILLAGILCLGLIAGCGKTKMTAAEAKFREECETYTFDELVDMRKEQREKLKILVSGTVSGHYTNDKGEKMFFIDTDEEKNGDILR